MSRRILFGLFAAVLFAAAASAQPTGSTGGRALAPDPELRAKFAARLEQVATSVDGVLAYAIVDLATGDRFVHGEGHVSPTASSIKTAILYELFRQADEGTLRLDENVTLDRRRAVPGGVLFEMGKPAISLRDTAVLMILLSDNTATNVLIERVGMDAVNATVKRLGLAETKLRRYMIDSAAARRGDENVSTPADLVRLYQAIEKGEGLSASAREGVLAILKKDKLASGSMGRLLPSGVVLANKPGDLEGIRVDAGIVYVKNRPYVFAAMGSWLADETAGERAISELSHLAYEYFARLGEATSYGRLIDR